MRESDLYPPVKAYLKGQGYEVKGEVGAADVMAVRANDPPVVVELKRGFSLALFHQGIARQAAVEAVYLCVARPGAAALKRNLGLARRLGLGVMTVRPRDGRVEVHCDPGPFQPRRSPARAARLLRAFERLRGDPNAGGATRHGLVTGYRQDALACARVLAGEGPLRAARVAALAEVPQARRIMADNYYGWFERVERGVYGLTDAGRRGLADWGTD
ncbi:DUF2161 domain-containing phosphodiesterase [Histidinibacterium aquaticum]|uniref:DUF2161 domain-containing phosphodiesterase n=1 Tax=Histidinibacterium aquaticum TaxID=2613962 RepID=A0A5J5GS52_9RHOB|nr:DUF2161 family putative PD-(D/E)XK-type phosphodiesterase [Histidinibacterium aquaticum]KAA9010384.1 hypothetical protein F3S47_03830 [Histidinibacterium aquaticum]